MFKFLRKLIVLSLAVILGFWLATTNILQGTMAGDWLNTIVHYIPAPQEWSNVRLQDPRIALENITASKAETDNPVVSSVAEDREKNPDIDYAVVEQRIFTLLNELREKQQVPILKSNDTLKEVANIRAVETEESFSHTRPDGSDTFSVFNEEGISYPYKLVGENLGMATNYLNEKEMAELLFNGWVESEGHYENMIRPEFEEVGIGVHYDGEFLYATQIFGTPL
ncbi:CAP domain-containing protein [Marinilactibacillus kalidii]|uniref:CAP domain-containing protein n=1 Tax=Marinilactibacillus kalidii TaxID=2820274 RepID=UPI001ABE5A4C|nr:CAP domain-containing protein [Marinilactibacillus kalidii]